MRKLIHNALNELADFAEENAVLSIVFLIFGILLIGAMLATTFGERIQ